MLQITSFQLNIVMNYCSFRFTIMLGVGQSLVEPQLAQGQELSGEVLLKVFGQKAVWVVPKTHLEVVDDNNNDDPKAEKVCYYFLENCITLQGWEMSLI